MSDTFTSSSIIEELWAMEGPSDRPCMRHVGGCPNEAVWLIVLDRPCVHPNQELCDPCKVSCGHFFNTDTTYKCLVDNCGAECKFLRMEPVKR